MTKKRRGRRPLPAAERKGKLVQARVPDALDETLRAEARQQRVSVSQLIRNVLEDTFELVEHTLAGASSLGRAVKRDAQRLAASAKGQARATASAVDAVQAWQEVVLARDGECARCGRLLRRGARGLYGISADPGAAAVWLCPACAAKL